MEKRTFNECPYSAEALQGRLGAPGSRALVAVAGEQVVGFLSGLHTPGLDGPRIEADLLAVDPAWQGQGIATALLVALREAAGNASLRGVVRPENPASECAFARAGFRPSRQVYDLLVYRILGTVPRQVAAWGGEVYALASLAEAAALAALAPAALPPPGRLWAAAQQPGLRVLLAVRNGVVTGGVGLVEVQTLLYSGLWLEGLVIRDGSRRAISALAAWAVEEAKARGLDTAGCLVPREQPLAREALLLEGYRPLDSYRTWMAGPPVRAV